MLNRFFMTMKNLHRNLCITYRHESWGQRMSFGKIIVSVAAIIFVIVTLTCFVLWLPRVWRWATLKHGLTVKCRSGFGRFLYDSHNTLGFYFLIPSLIMALTGLCWSFSWYRDGVSAVLGDQVFKQRMQRPMHTELPMDDSSAAFGGHHGNVVEDIFLLCMLAGNNAADHRRGTVG